MNKDSGNEKVYTFTVVSLENKFSRLWDLIHWRIRLWKTTLVLVESLHDGWTLFVALFLYIYNINLDIWLRRSNNYFKLIWMVIGCTSFCYCYMVNLFLYTRHSAPSLQHIFYLYKFWLFFFFLILTAVQEELLCQL